jgi:haloacetate dehalogenase
MPGLAPGIRVFGPGGREVDTGTRARRHALIKRMQKFTTAEIDTGETTVFTRRVGSGPPLLLLHGFPETQLMWRDIAPLLARDFTVVCADLPGYGQSGCPVASHDHAAHSKRAMAAGMLAVMTELGFPRFAIAGHDRGGRVAYRLALDHPQAVTRLAVLDILPVDIVWQRADAKFALGYWPWTLLAQPAPLPETILAAAADVIVDNALNGWGSPQGIVPVDIRAAYIAALRDLKHAQAICEEYRAAAGIDVAHNRADREAGKRIGCPVLALWSADGPLDGWYPEGPLALWRQWADDVSGQPVEGGHFFPEAAPGRTVELLRAFFGAPAQDFRSETCFASTGHGAEP